MPQLLSQQILSFSLQSESSSHVLLNQMHLNSVSIGGQPFLGIGSSDPAIRIDF